MSKELLSDHSEREILSLQELGVLGFVASGIDGISDSMSHYSLSPTPDALLRVGEVIQEAVSDYEIARALSAVEVSDSNFSRLDIIQDAADAYAITLAKAKAAEAKVSDGKTKESLRNFRDRILNSAGSVIAGVGGKKALATTAGLSLVATACGSLIGPKTQESSATDSTIPAESLEATEVAPVLSACEAVGNYCVVDSAEAGPGQGRPQSCTTASDGKPVNRTDDKGYCVRPEESNLGTESVEETEMAPLSACEVAGYICIHDSADALPGQGRPQSCTTASDGKPVNRTDDKGYCVRPEESNLGTESIEATELAPWLPDLLPR